ncbi:MAG: hypothetical protein U1E86_07685 [Burkholderiaceae bacterium]
MADPIDVVLRLVREHAPEVPDDALRRIDARARIEVGGDRHYVVSSSRKARELRNRKIMAALAAGACTSDVGRRFGLTRQAVWSIAKSRA